MGKRVKQYPTLWDGEIAGDIALNLPDNIEPIELDIPDMGIEVETIEFYIPELEINEGVMADTVRQKRYQYYTRNGIVWTEWFNSKAIVEEKWQLKGKLLNEYRTITLPSGGMR